MIGHHIGHVLKNLQILNLQLLTIFRLFLIGFFQLGQILENIPLNFARYRRGIVAEERKGTFFPLISISRLIILFHPLHLFLLVLLQSACTLLYTNSYKYRSLSCHQYVP